MYVHGQPSGRMKRLRRLGTLTGWTALLSLPLGLFKSDVTYVGAQGRFSHCEEKGKAVLGILGFVRAWRSNSRMEVT